MEVWWGLRALPHSTSPPPAWYLLLPPIQIFLCNHSCIVFVDIPESFFLMHLPLSPFDAVHSFAICIFNRILMHLAHYATALSHHYNTSSCKTSAIWFATPVIWIAVHTIVNRMQWTSYHETKHSAIVCAAIECITVTCIWQCILQDITVQGSAKWNQIARSQCNAVEGNQIATNQSATRGGVNASPGCSICFSPPCNSPS